MFETRVHSVSPLDAVNKRKLWEGFLQWANRFSRIDSDNLKRLSLSRENFTIDSFLDMYESNTAPADSGGMVSGDTGVMVATSQKFVSLETAGEYWVNWSISLQRSNGDCRFVGAVPFVGDQIIGSAQDFKAEMGWYNNMSVAEAESRGPMWGEIGGKNRTPDGSGGYHVSPNNDQAYEFVYDEYDHYGRQGHQRHTRHGATEKTIRPSQLTSTKVIAKVHLSGAGGGLVGRVTGNIGIIVYAFPGSTFNVIASTLTVHRRNR